MFPKKFIFYERWEIWKPVDRETFSEAGRKLPEQIHRLPQERGTTVLIKVAKYAIKKMKHILNLPNFEKWHIFHNREIMKQKLDLHHKFTFSSAVEL